MENNSKLCSLKNCPQAIVTNFGGNLESNLTKTHCIRNFPPHFQGRVEEYIFFTEGLRTIES